MAEHAQPESIPDGAADADSSDGAGGAGEKPPKLRLDATQPFGSQERVSETDAARLVEILDSYLAGLKAGQAPNREQLLAEHPELAEPLQACLAGLEFIHSASDASSVSSPQTLGDFRIAREVGRGGMGAVFEAEQISLGRRVALKILRFGGVSDPEAIQRFQREAETVARLHHTNIVPIFAVGSEQGVNYYAMQFIDGQSLDQVLRERTERREPIDAETIAQWGLEAAEALAHAHARGVIHRDVKPSNLLIDHEEGRIWLTDFGLAKRLDDVTLSMTGALLGTPRYMSPEQAATTHHQLDHRTDIYSLGASLYELATGQPVFCGDSPHKVISQILTADPEPPRKHRPSLPRDLETILMKCLSKEASQRYDSARQLSDDLRAYLDGRPIAARRANVVEQATRWVRRQRRSVALAAGAVAATLLLVTLGTAAGYAWHRSRLAMLMFKTNHPPLVAELIRDGEHVVPPVTVPTQRRIEVPAGEYQLRLSGDNRLSQDFGMTLGPGQFLAHKLDLEDQLLWQDVNLERSYRMASVAQYRNLSSANENGLQDDGSEQASGSQSAVIELTSDGIRCLQGTTGSLHWEINLVTPKHEILKENNGLAWPWDRSGNGFNRGLGPFDSRPWVVSDTTSEAATAGVAMEPIVDFDRDGVTDMLLAARHQAWMIAVSGRDGRPLWIAARGDAADSEATAWNRGGGSAVVYAPIPVSDQDGDGVADVVTTFIYKRDQRTEVERWIELISGSSGEPIWRYDLPAELFGLISGERVPYDLQWFYGHSGGYSSSGGSHSVRQHYRVRTPSELRRSGSFEYLPTEPKALPRQRQLDHLAAGADIGSSPASTSTAPTDGLHLVFVAGQHLMQLALDTGQPVETSPQNMNTRPLVQPRYGDLDGDRHVDLLLVEPLPRRAAPGGGKPMQRLIAWSISQQSRLWHRDIQASEPQQSDMVTPPADWPQLSDLDGDGVCEVIAPDLSSQNDWYSVPWGQLAVFDGRTGKPRWQRQILNVDQQADWFTVGPDINRDGVREVFLASQWGDDFRLFVDCLSGSDGQSLWRLEEPLMNRENESGMLRLAALSWYESTGDGWPQLVVCARHTSGDVTDRTVVISSGTGRTTHVAPGVTEAHPSDLDADGVDDLVLFRRNDLHDLHNGGKLYVFRGVGRQAWRKIVPPQVTVGDLDGDGVRDLINKETRGELEAYSGATGERIWRTQFEAERRAFYVYPTTSHDVRHDLLVPAQDLNGDGTPDLIVMPTSRSFRGKQPLLIAFSGRDGRLLWKADFMVQIADQPFLLDCRDLDGDGDIEVVVAAATDYGLGARSPGMGVNDARLWLTVLSGRNGQLRWAEPLTETQTDGAGRQFELNRVWLESEYADLDDDGTLDLVLPAQRSAGSEQLDMLAISGGDGHVLWRYPLPPFQSPREAFCNVVPAAAGDLDGDGRMEVAVLELDRAVDDRGNTADVIRLSVLRGESGDLLWQWQTTGDRWGNDIDQNPDRVKNRIRPLLVRRPDGKQWVALSFWNNPRELCVLDETGRVVSRGQGEEKFDGLGRRLWAIDADGDGGDELVFLSDTHLSLLPPDRLDQPIWTRAKAASDFPRVAGIIQEESAAGCIVVLGGRGDHSLRGFDPATGDVVWTCVGPAGGSVPTNDKLAVLLNAPAADAPPHALYQFDMQAFVRRGSLSSGTPGSWRSFDRRPPVLVPEEHDSRLVRPLPWKPADYAMEALLAFIAWSAFYGITLVGVPLLFGGWMIRRRRWGMKTMLMLPVVAVAVISAFLIRPEDPEFHSPANKLLYAFAVAGPVMFALATFAHWLRHGHWRRVATSLSAALLIGLAIMAVSLFIIEPGKSSAPRPGERYSWDGWYFMFLPVLYVLSWLLTTAMIGTWLLRPVWRRFTRGIGT